MSGSNSDDTQASFMRDTNKVITDKVKKKRNGEVTQRQQL